MRTILSAIFGRACLAVFLGGISLAQPGQTQGLRSLVTGDDSRAYAAVGRLNLGPRGFCTGTLIAPQVVLTAAHCLFDKRTGLRFKASQIQFLAGWRDGRADAYRGARRVLAHPTYEHGSRAANHLAHDMAVIELDRPIRATEIPFFATAVAPIRGDEVGVVSYAHNRSERPAIQQLCHVIGRQSGALITSCDVDFGASGAPVLSFATGAPQVVSVVSAKAQLDGKKVAIGTDLLDPLTELLTELSLADGVFRRAKPATRPVSETASRQTGSAKFIRP